jgi:peptidoglycan-associated lipoprotein
MRLSRSVFQFGTAGLLAASALLALSGCSAVPTSTYPETAVYVRHPHVSAPVASVSLPDDSDSLLSRRTIYFDFDAFDVRQSDLVLLRAHAQYMVSRPGSRLRIEGHADERGGTEYNLALGQKRANGVSLALLQAGVPSLALEAVSLGEEMPVDPAHDESAWALNRRVELRYLAR